MLYGTGLAQSTAAFLRVVPDAAGAGLGGASQALPLGATDLFTNPALLDLNRGSVQVALSNLIEYNLFQYGALAVSFPLGQMGTAGVGLVGLNYPDLARYDQVGQLMGTFNQYNVALLLAFSRQMLPFSVGAGLRVVQMGFGGLEGGNTGRGFSLDLGFYFTPRQSLKMGLSLHTGYAISWRGGYQEAVPRQLQLGFLWQPPLLGQRLIGFVWGIDQVRDEPARLNAGVRLGFGFNQAGQPALAFFGGMNRLPLETRNQAIELGQLTSAERIYTAGAQLRIGSVRVSYAAWLHSRLPLRHLLTTKFEL
ncbi:MAG: hypothetical protein D6715_05875 [Calditrichaeota bacterium]|nr:MAG: hypothetical protein D6715_05875 [Calditrichota bacterium]